MVAAGFPVIRAGLKLTGLGAAPPVGTDEGANTASGGMAVLAIGAAMSCMFEDIGKPPLMGTPPGVVHRASGQHFGTSR